MIELQHFLILSSLLFLIGVFGIFLNRKNIKINIKSIELNLLAVNINFVSFSSNHYTCLRLSL